MPKRTVFISRDDQIQALLDTIHVELEKHDINVVRGPTPDPGSKLVYRPEDYNALFSKAEVMTFSSRSSCTRDVMLAAPRLRGIVAPAIGVETIDVPAATELGIIVGHSAVPENYMSMAESTVILMLALRYQLHRSEQVLRGQVSRPPKDKSWSHMMRGCTIGLIGYGRIAAATAKLLHAFDVKILAYHPRLSPKDVPEGVHLVELDTLLRESDLVSVHVSITDSSKCIVGARELGLMKTSAYLLNTARGQAVDENALCDALARKQIAGAALDTFATEPLPQNSPLRTFENVILTPHMVGHTQESFTANAAAAVENILRVLAGEPPLYCKNPQVLDPWRKRLTLLSGTN